MNYLAHIYLSGNNDNLKIGNFIADSVKGKDYLKYPPDIQKGIMFHRAIDDFTDSHPIFRKSTGRLFEKYGHYSRVIVDVLYDHFLAANWQKFSQIPLKEYVDDFYELLEENFEILPKRVRNFYPFMRSDNWLVSYSTIQGIGKILSQMNRRTDFNSNMNKAVEDLKAYYNEFENDFFNFFKELEVFCHEKRAEL